MNNSDINEPLISDSYESLIQPRSTATLNRKRTRQMFESSDEETEQTNSKKRAVQKPVFGEPWESSINDDGNINSELHNNK